MRNDDLVTLRLERDEARAAYRALHDKAMTLAQLLVKENCTIPTVEFGIEVAILVIRATLAVPQEVPKK